MSSYVKVNGQIKSVIGWRVKVSNSWKEVSDVLVKRETEWSSTESNLIPKGGVYTKTDGTVLTSGKFPEPVRGDIFAFGDYEYGYQIGHGNDAWSTSYNTTGWAVWAIDKTKTSYTEMLPIVGEYPVTSLYNCFYNCKNVGETGLPAIPETVVTLDWAYQYCKIVNSSNIVIPNSVKTMYGTFADCTSLITAGTIPAQITDVRSLYTRCTALTGNIYFNCSTTLSNYSSCLADTSKSITVRGTTSDTNKKNIAETATNGNVVWIDANGNTQTVKSFSSSVSTASGASYGFNVNSSGYYESTNQGVANSAAVCVLTITVKGSYTVYLDCINYGESSYDYGIIGNKNSTLSTSYTADSSYLKTFSGSQSTSIQTVTLGTLSNETATYYIKYRKDGSVDSGYDSLQFKVRYV